MRLSCPFCEMKDYLFENEDAFAIFDKYPVNKGHVLIIPKRHVSDYFETTDAERVAIENLLFICRDHLIKNFSPDGFNVGMNCGGAAGQTVFHAHVHLIPRNAGDMDDPRGGVRGVIPNKQKY